MAEVGCLKDSHIQNLEVNQQSLITGNQIIEGEQTIKGSLKFTDGGAIEQLTSKSTGITLNSRSGKITTHNASLAANGVVSFTVTNSSITAGRCIRMLLCSSYISIAISISIFLETNI